MGKLTDIKLLRAISLPKGKKGLYALIICLISLIIVALTIWWVFFRVAVIDVRSDADSTQSYYDKLIREKPSEQASVAQKDRYLSELLVVALEAKDYEAAEDTFNERLALLGDTFPARGYLELAMIHCRQGDQAAANKAFDQVIKQSKFDTRLQPQERTELATAAEESKKGGCESWLAVFDQQ